MLDYQPSVYLSELQAITNTFKPDYSNKFIKNVKFLVNDEINAIILTHVVL
jgi:hypothetical protein